MKQLLEEEILKKIITKFEISYSKFEHLNKYKVVVVTYDIYCYHISNIIILYYFLF